MKKLILLVLILLSISFAIGQNREIIGGGGGHFMTGITYVFANNMTDYLQEPTVIGTGYDPSPLGLQAGGEGYGLVGRFSLGGGGFGFNSFNASGPNGKVERAGGGGYFKMGYRFFTKNTSFVAFNAGVGGFGYSLKIKNTSTDNNIMFNRLDPILPGEEKTYDYGGTLFDLGFSFKSLFTKNMEAKEVGGFIAGLDAGCILGVPAGDWKGDEQIQGPPDPGVMVTPYIRLTIGGGGFKFE
ncbi:MAG: hypothetical protein IPM82_06800 [Saprospiraceae bacterium]|nr:hypothetical protein [Saprospiraceae bacterium]